MKWMGPNQHFLKDRKLELFLGFGFFIVGALLLWDAYDNRGVKMKWPLGAIAPW